MTSIASRDAYPNAVAVDRFVAAALCVVKETVPNVTSAWQYAAPHFLLVVRLCYCVVHDCFRVVDLAVGIAAVALKARDTAQRRLANRSL